MSARKKRGVAAKPRRPSPDGRGAPPATASRRRAGSPAATSRRGTRTPAATSALSLPEMQRRVDAWIMQFEEGYWPPLSMLARLSEEVGELARELNHHYGHKPKKADEPPGDIALEVADIIFVLTCLCNSLEIDMTQAFERVLAKYTHRDARRWTPRRVP